MELATPGDPITAVLDMLAAHAERLAQLDAQLSTIAAAAGRVSELAALASQLDQRITALGLNAGQASPDGPDGWGPYAPAPSRRWWKLQGRDRDKAITALQAWVEQVYRPGYGQLAATLGTCWDQHTLCLYALDILAEFWSLLYLADDRPPSLLSTQAEYQARLLPALAEQMAAETSRCRHRRDQQPPGTGPARRIS